MYLPLGKCRILVHPPAVFIHEVNNRRRQLSIIDGFYTFPCYITIVISIYLIFTHIIIFLLPKRGSVQSRVSLMSVVTRIGTLRWPFCCPVGLRTIASAVTAMVRHLQTTMFGTYLLHRRGRQLSHPLSPSVCRACCP